MYNSVFTVVSRGSQPAVDENDPVVSAIAMGAVRVTVGTAVWAMAMQASAAPRVRILVDRNGVFLSVLFFRRGGQRCKRDV
jgi:hypothetical protein